MRILTNKRFVIQQQKQENIIYVVKLNKAEVQSTNIFHIFKLNIYLLEVFPCFDITKKDLFLLESMKGYILNSFYDENNIFLYEIYIYIEIEEYINKILNLQKKKKYIKTVHISK